MKVNAITTAMKAAPATPMPTSPPVESGGPSLFPKELSVALLCVGEGVRAKLSLLESGDMKLVELVSVLNGGGLSVMMRVCFVTVTTSLLGIVIVLPESVLMVIGNRVPDFSVSMAGSFSDDTPPLGWISSLGLEVVRVALGGGQSVSSEAVLSAPLSSATRG